MTTSPPPPIKVKSITTTEDRLTELPYFLILHILSFLDIKEVVQTSVLSKKWKFTWTGISEVDLELPDSTGQDLSVGIAKIGTFVDFVGKLLTLCKDLQKFGLSFTSKCISSSTIDFWIELLVRNKVNDIELECGYASYYELPQVFYSHSSLTRLSIKNCHIKPRGEIEWISLKSLSMENMKFSDNVMDKLLLGCSALEFMQLTLFQGLTTLNISSPNLTTLVIEEECPLPDKEAVEISAPHVRDLTISVCVEETRFIIKDISSVVRAKLDFSYLTDLTRFDDYSTPEAMDYIKQLFQSLSSVEELELGWTCIEILSVFEIMGGKLPRSTISCLTINAYNHEGSVPGIVAVLKSSWYLQTLVVRGHEIDHRPIDDQEESDLITRNPAIAYLWNEKPEFTLCHLKTVNVSRFIFFHGEPMLKFAEMLLKSAKLLEKMDIFVDEEVVKVFASPIDATSHLDEIASYLLNFPRASAEAVVMFHTPTISEL